MSEKIKFSALAFLEECPKCGGKLEKGYINADFVNWSDKERKLIGTGETVIFPRFFTVPNAEARRCQKCKLVTFYYGFIPSETPKSFLKKCVNCDKEIPIASQYCLHCGAKQPEWRKNE